jgi:hypothetical protein
LTPSIFSTLFIVEMQANIENFIISKGQMKNLKRYLTRAQFTSKELPNQLDAPTVTRCEEPRCSTCKVIISGKTITFKNERKWKHHWTVSQETIYMPWFVRNTEALHWPNRTFTEKMYSSQGANTPQTIQTLICKRTHGEV